MPDFKQLLKDSWEAFKGSLLNLVILSVLGSILGIIFGSLVMFGVVGVGFITALSTENGTSQEISREISQAFLDIASSPKILGLYIAGAVIFILLIILVGIIFRIAAFVAIGNYKEKVRLGYCLKMGIKLLIPVTVVSLVTSLISFGGTLFFIIPGMILSLLFSFTIFEMVLGEKKWFTSITGSVRIMYQHFGEVFLRILAIWVGSLVILQFPHYILRTVSRALMESAPGEATVLFLITEIIYFVVSGVFGYFWLAYTTVVYQHAKAATDETKKPNMLWIWIVSALGWLLAIIMIFIGIRIFQSEGFQKRVQAIIQSGQETSEKLSESAQVAKFLEDIDPEARPYVETSNDLFIKIVGNRDNPDEVKNLSNQNIDALLKAVEIDPNNPEIWDALGTAYTWLNDRGTLEDSYNAYKKAEELAPQLYKYQSHVGFALIKLERYDEAVIQMQKALRTDDNQGLGHVYLGMAMKHIGLKESSKEELQRGIDILNQYNENGQFDSYILNAMKELESVDDFIIKEGTGTTSTAPVAPSCTYLNIREGEFASNKCYSKKDYDDLNYYLQRYNSAVFTYNGAISSMNITCNGSDFFKDKCEQDKEEKEEAEKSMSEYKGIIKDIISRGK